MYKKRWYNFYYRKEMSKALNDLNRPQITIDDKELVDADFIKSGKDKYTKI